LTATASVLIGCASAWRGIWRIDRDGVKTARPSKLGQEGYRLPALRNVRTVFPHTALQLVVTSLGLACQRVGFFQGEQPTLNKVHSAHRHEARSPFCSCAFTGARARRFERTLRIAGSASDSLDGSFLFHRRNQGQASHDSGGSHWRACTDRHPRPTFPYRA
jgi:hypothetical protein